jgi:hypothetical protein
MKSVGLPTHIQEAVFSVIENPFIRIIAVRWAAILSVRRFFPGFSFGARLRKSPGFIPLALTHDHTRPTLSTGCIRFKQNQL